MKMVFKDIDYKEHNVAMTEAMIWSIVIVW